MSGVDKLFATIPDDWFEIDHDTGNIKFVGPEGEDYKGEPFTIPQFYRWIESQFNAERVMDMEMPLDAYVKLLPPYHLDDSCAMRLQHGTIQEEDCMWMGSITTVGDPLSPDDMIVLQPTED